MSMKEKQCLDLSADSRTVFSTGVARLHLLEESNGNIQQSSSFLK